MAQSITPWSAGEIVAITNGELYGIDDWSALAVSTDTRTLQKGDLFVALRGANFKGEDFLSTALEKGAVAAIVQDYHEEIALPQIVVRDTLFALTALARERRERSGAVVIGLTGTNGKTSTKEMLARILSEEGETLATIGNLNNDIGVPLTLLRLRDVHRFAVIEMGANHVGEIQHLVTIARPNVAAVTNISAAHLEGFGSLEGVVQTKSEMYAFTSEKMVINADLVWAKAWQERYASREKKSFSLVGKGDIIARSVSSDGSQFEVDIEGKTFTVHWQLRGKHNVANALCACAIAHLVGIASEKMSGALNGLQLHHSRLQAFSVGEHRIYDDTYNANPASFRAGIDVIAAAPQSLVIAGRMAELGERSDALHREVREYAEKAGVTRFWSLNAPAYGGEDFSSLEEMAVALKDLLATDTAQTVLVKGSRSANMERVFVAAELEEFRKNRKG